MTGVMPPLARSARLGRARFAVWGSEALLLVTEPDIVEFAEALLRTELAAMDKACSRFRADSELQRLGRRTGASVPVSPLLAGVLDGALRAARLTDGLVDPTVGAALLEWGYDRDFAALPADGPVGAPAPAPGWWRITLDRRAGTVVVPRGVVLDLGATAKAWAADRTAHRIAEKFGCGALVNLGGDVSVAGPAPSGGWRLRIGDDHTRPDLDDPVVTVASGGVATSGVARRHWRRGGNDVHHIIDPRTGWPAAPVWRTVSVAAGDCADANAAATAAVVLGAAGPDWLVRAGLPARLVAADGTVHTVAGWPTAGGGTR